MALKTDTTFQQQESFGYLFRPQRYTNPERKKGRQLKRKKFLREFLEWFE